MINEPYDPRADLEPPYEPPPAQMSGIATMLTVFFILAFLGIGALLSMDRALAKQHPFIKHAEVQVTFENEETYCGCDKFGAFCIHANLKENTVQFQILPRDLCVGGVFQAEYE